MEDEYLDRLMTTDRRAYVAERVKPPILTFGEYAEAAGLAVLIDEAVPADELWLVRDGKILGRIVNIGVAA